MQPDTIYNRVQDYQPSLRFHWINELNSGSVSAGLICFLVVAGSLERDSSGILPTPLPARL